VENKLMMMIIIALVTIWASQHSPCRHSVHTCSRHSACSAFRAWAMWRSSEPNRQLDAV